MKVQGLTSQNKYNVNLAATLLKPLRVISWPLKLFFIFWFLIKLREIWALQGVSFSKQDACCPGVIPVGSGQIGVITPTFLSQTTDFVF